MASGGNSAPDDSEDDGDPPVQERQPERLRDRLISRSVDVAPPVVAAAPRGGAWRTDNPDGLPLYHLQRNAAETADNPRLLGEPPSCCPSPTPSLAPVPDLLELLHVKKGALQP
ncbi:hypothetical protein HPB51_004212 [Rhipicephalus microplus]|uniref:Uncharacterized protein n=1 Tax=Rhipicephalus microplus TaxID=6941 RepID=A0A9J6DZ75_RHIMP|nr:hypothetical protein HPB51_004212 [Rhipicephalus microplus]